MFRNLAYLEIEAYSEPWYIHSPRHIQNTVKHLRQKVLQKQLPRTLLSPRLKDKKACSEKISYIFSRKGNFLIYQEKKHSYISGKRNPKKCLMFQGRTSELKKLNKPTPKKCSIFREMKLSSPKLKKLIIFRERTCKT